MTVTELDNGISAIYYPIHNAFSVSIGLYIKTGAMYENKTNNGITHFLEHLHFRKLGMLTQENLYNAMDKIGATLQATTYKDFLRFYIKARPKYLNECLKFFKDIITEYEWNTEQIEAEKKVVLNEIYEKESYFYMQSHIDELLYQNTSLSMSILGTAESINSLTLEQVTDFKKNFFCKNNLFLAVTGNISETDINYINSELKKIKIDCDSLNITNIKKNNDSNIKIKFVNCNWNVVDINLTFRIDYKQASQEEITVLSSILGGGVGSVISLAIREKSGLAYSVSSSYNFFKDFATIDFNLSVSKKNIYDGISQIVEILNYSKNSISEKDLETNLPYFTDNLWFWLENPEKLNFNIGMDVFVNGLKPYTIEEKIDTYRKISVKRLMPISDNIFHSKNAAVVIMGSTGKITKKELKNIIRELDD